MGFVHIDHVGIVAYTIEQAQEVLGDALGLELDEPRSQWPTGSYFPPEQTYNYFFQVGGGRDPGRGADPARRARPAGAARFLERRGPGLHHLCYACADVHAEAERLLANGLEEIDMPRQPPTAGAPWRSSIPAAPAASSPSWCPSVPASSTRRECTGLRSSRRLPAIRSADPVSAWRPPRSTEERVRTSRFPPGGRPSPRRRFPRTPGPDRATSHRSPPSPPVPRCAAVRSGLRPRLGSR